MAIEKLIRDPAEFSRFQNTSQKPDIDVNFNAIVDKLNEIIERVNTLQVNKIEGLPAEYNNKFLFVNKDNQLEGRNFPAEDLEAITVQYIPDNFVTSNMIQENSITSGHIQIKSITEDLLDDYCITSRHLDIGFIKPEHLEPGFMMDGSKIKDNSLDGACLIDHSIGISKLDPSIFQQTVFYTSHKTDYLVYNKKGNDSEILGNCIPYLTGFDKDVVIHFKVYGVVKLKEANQDFLQFFAGGNPHLRFAVLNSNGEEISVSDYAPLFFDGDSMNDDGKEYKFLTVINLPPRTARFTNQDNLIITIPDTFENVNLYIEVIPNGGFVEEGQ